MTIVPQEKRQRIVAQKKEPTRARSSQPQYGLVQTQQGCSGWTEPPVIRPHHHEQMERDEIFRQHFSCANLLRLGRIYKDVDVTKVVTSQDDGMVQLLLPFMEQFEAMSAGLFLFQKLGIPPKKGKDLIYFLAKNPRCLQRFLEEMGITGEAPQSCAGPQGLPSAVGAQASVSPILGPSGLNFPSASCLKSMDPQAPPVFTFLMPVCPKRGPNDMSIVAVQQPAVSQISSPGCLGALPPSIECLGPSLSALGPSRCFGPSLGIPPMTNLNIHPGPPIVHTFSKQPIDPIRGLNNGGCSVLKSFEDQQQQYELNKLLADVDVQKWIAGSNCPGMGKKLLNMGPGVVEHGKNPIITNQLIMKPHAPGVTTPTVTTNKASTSMEENEVDMWESLLNQVNSTPAATANAAFVNQFDSDNLNDTLHYEGLKILNLPSSIKIETSWAQDLKPVVSMASAMPSPMDRDGFYGNALRARNAPCYESLFEPTILDDFIPPVKKEKVECLADAELDEKPPEPTLQSVYQFVQENKALVLEPKAMEAVDARALAVANMEIMVPVVEPMTLEAYAGTKTMAKDVETVQEAMNPMDKPQTFEPDYHESSVISEEPQDFAASQEASQDAGTVPVPHEETLLETVLESNEPSVEDCRELFEEPEAEDYTGQAYEDDDDQLEDVLLHESPSEQESLEPQFKTASEQVLEPPKVSEAKDDLNLATVPADAQEDVFFDEQEYPVVSYEELDENGQPYPEPETDLDKLFGSGPIEEETVEEPQPESKMPEVLQEPEPEPCIFSMDNLDDYWARLEAEEAAICAEAESNGTIVEEAQKVLQGIQDAQKRVYHYNDFAEIDNNATQMKEHLSVELAMKLTEEEGKPRRSSRKRNEPETQSESGDDEPESKKVKLSKEEQEMEKIAKAEEQRFQRQHGHESSGSNGQASKSKSKSSTE